MSRGTSDFEVYRAPLLRLLERTGWPTLVEDDFYYYSLGVYELRGATEEEDEEEESGGPRLRRRLLVARRRHVNDSHHGWFTGHEYVVFEGSPAQLARLLESAQAVEERGGGGGGGSVLAHKRYLGRNGFSCKYDFYHWHGYALCRVDELARLLRAALSTQHAETPHGFVLTPAYPYAADDWSRLRTALNREPPQRETLYKLVSRKRMDRRAFLFGTRVRRGSALVRGGRQLLAQQLQPATYLCEVSSGAPLGMPVRHSAVDSHTTLSSALPPLHVTLTNKQGARTQLQENVLDAVPFAQCCRHYSVALSAALWSLMPRGLRGRQLFYASNLSLDAVMTAKQPGSPKFVLERRYLTETVALGRLPSGQTYVRVAEKGPDDDDAATAAPLLLLLSEFVLEAAASLLLTAPGAAGFGVFTSGTLSKHSTAPEFLINDALLLSARGFFVAYNGDQWHRVCNVYYAPVVIEFAALLAHAPCVAPQQQVETALQFVSVPCAHKSAHERYRWHVYHSARPQTPLLRDLCYRHYMSHVVSALLKQPRGRPLEPALVIDPTTSARLRRDCQNAEGLHRGGARSHLEPSALPPEPLLGV